MIDEPTNATNKETTSGDSEIVQENNENPISEETTPKDGQNSLPVSPPAVAPSSPEASEASTMPALENSTDLGDSHSSVPVEGLGADGGNLKGVEYDNIPTIEPL